MAACAQRIAAILGVIGVLSALVWIAQRPPSIRDLLPSGELRVGVDASYPPFAAVGDDLFGLDIDLARALGDEIGVSVRFVNLGFDGLYDALLTDQVDVLISALPIDNARRDRVIYTDPYFNAGLVLIAPMESEIGGMPDVGGRRLAYELGSSAHVEADRWTRRIAVFDKRPYALERHALDAVRLAQADAALVDAISAGLYRHDYPLWEVQQIPVTDSLFAIAVRADHPELADALNRAMRELFWRGDIQRIIDLWL